MNLPKLVMRGLDPRTYPSGRRVTVKAPERVDPRVKPAGDGWGGVVRSVSP